MTSGEHTAGNAVISKTSDISGTAAGIVAYMGTAVCKVELVQV